MTLPDERYLAVQRTRQFLLDLMDPKKYPRVAREVRQEARSLLKHFPTEWHMQQVSDVAPDIFNEHMDPLVRMVLEYQQEHTT